MMHLKDAAEERGQADQRDVRQHDDAEAQDQQVVRRPVEADEQGDEHQFADDRHGDEHAGEQIHRGGGEVIGVGVSIDGLCVERHERGGERAFAEQFAEEIGNRERDLPRRPHAGIAEVAKRDHLPRDPTSRESSVITPMSLACDTTDLPSGLAGTIRTSIS